VVVTHGGYGTIIEALRLGKVPVVMPRRRKYQEHVDDHQVDLAEELALQKRIVLVHEVTELHSAIIEAQSRKAESATPEPLLAKLVAKAIDELLAAG
jgi:beta-1,4-N-acetylglucosaminyltransferase